MSVINIETFNPSELKYGQPKKNKVGKSISVISTKTNKYLELSMPRLMTWGISDFYDKEKDTHDGKFSITLAFPRTEEETEKTNLALEKLKKFQDQILADACKNKDKWWDNNEDIDDAAIKVMMYKFIKYPKNKDTKKIDYTRPPSIQAKVECWEGKWKPKIFNTKKEILFPSPSAEADGLTPADFVPKLSNVSCTIECAGIWIGEKGWGITWRLKQCVVKPNDTMSNSDVCQVEFDDEDATTIENQKVSGDDIDIDVETGTVYKAGVAVEDETKVEDSDTEEEKPAVVETVVVEATKVVKKKKAPETVVETPVETVVETPVVIETTKVVKKKKAST
jgi:hypothetical protein